MMQERIRINRLLDCYGVLLTKKQQEICRFYYREDLSYNEIAELEGTSRTAVYDAVKQSCSAMEEYEEKLHMLKNSTDRIALYEKIKEKTNDTGILKLVDQCRETEV